jgi:hypothetical protein
LTRNPHSVTLGNLAENRQAFPFLMDHEWGRRIKIWGRAWSVEDEPALISRLMPRGDEAHADGDSVRS